MEIYFCGGGIAMPLIPGICTQCGATLSVDKEKDAMMCPYCHTPFVVEKAIQNFNNTYNIINNITAENVYVQDVRNEFEIVAGVLKKYHGQSLEVVVPDNVFEIGEGAFKGLYVTSVTLPKSVKKIGESAFEETKITTFTMPDSVEVVRTCAFYNCSDLKTIHISNKLKKIELNTFSGCKSLEEVHLPSCLEILGCDLGYISDKPDIDDVYGCSVFYGCTNLKAIYLSSENVKKFKTCGIEFEDIDIYIDNKKLEYSDEFVTKFPGSKEYKKLLQIRKEKMERENQRKKEQYRMSNNLCLECGGSFKGIFEKRCMKCGKEKNY